MIEVTPATVGGDALTDEDKAKLSALLTSANGEANTNWYNEEDRYNGTPADTIDDVTSGFWKEFTAEGGPRAQAQSVLENATSVEQITEATEALQTAIDKLIPTTQINPTVLYETIQKYTTSEFGYYEDEDANKRPVINGVTSGKLLSDYTEETADAYRAALKNAQDYLASLYDEDGGATAENVAANQSKADGYVTALDNAVAALAKPLTAGAIATLQRYRDTIVALNGLFANLNQDDYTEESWKTFADAKAAATATLEANLTELLKHPTDKTEFPPYQSKMTAYYKAAYGLVPKGEATVTLHISDSKAMRGKADPLPADLLLHEQTVTLNGETGYSIIELLAAAGIDETEAEANFGYEALVYINGVLIRNPVYSSSDTLLSIPLGKQEYTRWDQLIRVKDGDVVTISRVEKPGDMYFIHPVDAAFAKVTASFAQLHFTDASVKTAKEGEAIPLQLQKTLSFILNQGGRSIAAANMELVVYGPQNPDGSYPTTPTRTSLTTDASGNVTLKLYQAGTYLVTAFDPREQDADASFYPQITVAAAPFTVTVTALDDSAFAAEKAAYIAEVDALLNACNADVMGPEPYAQAQAAAETAKTSINAAESLADARAAVEAAVSTINDLVEAANTANEEAVRKMTNYLLLLPSVEDIAAGRVFDGDMARFNEASMHDSRMTDYQRGQLTGAQTAQWNALVTYITENYDSLPEKEIKVTVEVVGGYGDRLSGKVIAGKFKDIMDSSAGIDSYSNVEFTIDSLSEVSTASFAAPVEWPLVVLEASEWEDFEVYDVVWEGVDYSDTTRVYERYDGVLVIQANAIELVDTVTGEVRGIPFGSVREDIKLTIYTRSHSDAGAMRDAALQALTDAYNGYDKAAYTSDGWAALTSAYNDGLAAVRAAADEDITSAKETALAAMAAVQTRKQEQAAGGQEDDTVGELGSVYVTVTNNTYSGGDFTGTFISETVALNENTTMMSAVLTALERNGYDWTGTGGTKGANSYDDWNISYISSIEKDDKRLAEFSSTAGSGWMGTLNDWFVHEGFSSFTASASNANYRIVDSDVIAIQFTEDLGVDLGGGWGNPDTSLKALSVTGGKLTPAFSGSTTEYVLMLNGSSATVTPTASNKNYQVRTYINEQSGSNWYRRGTALPVKAGDVIYIGVGGDGWPSMNNNPGYEISYTGTWYTITVVDTSNADAVVDLISAIGDVTYANYEAKESAVASARAAYDALNSTAKAKVTNLATLTAAEEQITFYSEIDNVKDLLDAIPAVDKLTKSDKSKVQAAQNAYNKLSEEQQLYITVADVAKYNAAVEWLEEHNIVIPGGTISGADKAPESSEITVPISGEQNSIDVAVTVDGTKATISEVDMSDLGTVIGDKVSTGTVTIDFSGLESDEAITTVEIPAAVVKQIAEAANSQNNDTESLEIVLSDGTSIEFDAEALKEKAAQANGADITISIESHENVKLTNAQKKALGDRPAFDINVTSGGKHISDMGGKITVHAPYTLKSGETARGVVVYYVDDNGNKERCETSYDAVKKRVNWKTDHLSLYMIDYDETLANNPFTDVSEEAYYFDAVMWAVDKGVTNGTSETTFSPEASCTRAQMVTFLWRAAGSPEPTSTANPFSDVDENGYYYKALLWAIENGITKGTSETTFSPDAVCTRGQMATFLYRNAKSPAVTGEHPFTDVKETAYYNDAVIWAVAEGITKGTSETTFSPDADCTRGQMVTFLYRYLAE